MDHPQLSMPGNSDLDLDCYNLVITSVVRVDYELIISWKCSDSRWINDEGKPAHVTDVNGDITIGPQFEGDPKPEEIEFWDNVFEQFQKWHDNSTELRMVSAPGKAANIWDPVTKEWLPLPRTSKSTEE